MSDLTAFRDHCRAMAVTDAKLAAAIVIHTDEDLITAIRLADDSDLWTRLADEIDTWLDRGPDPAHHDEPLWETP